MGTKIDTVTARSKLTPQREPHWHKVSKGLFIGFRKMTEESPGVWLFRHQDGGRDMQRSLGALETFGNHERFDQALILARQWISDTDEAPTAAANRTVTVWDACSAYVWLDAKAARA